VFKISGIDSVVWFICTTSVLQHVDCHNLCNTAVILIWMVWHLWKQECNIIKACDGFLC